SHAAAGNFLQQFIIAEIANVPAKQHWLVTCPGCVEGTSRRDANQRQTHLSQALQTKPFRCVDGQCRPAFVACSHFNHGRNRLVLWNFSFFSSLRRLVESKTVFHSLSDRKLEGSNRKSETVPVGSRVCCSFLSA